MTSEAEPALAEGVDAEAGDALDRVGEVDLVRRRRTRRACTASSRIVADGGLGVLGGERLGRPVDRAAGWPSTRMSGREGTLRCRSEPPAGDEVAQGAVDVEHVLRWIGRIRATLSAAA